MTDLELPPALMERRRSRRLPRVLVDEVTFWMRDNLAGQWWFSADGPVDRVRFDDIADAFLFKIRWL